MAQDRAFPQLTPAQIARLAAVGEQRIVQKGEIVVEQGQHAPGFFVVVSG